jgi:hypothetical protein
MGERGKGKGGKGERGKGERGEEEGRAERPECVHLTSPNMKLVVLGDGHGNLSTNRNFVNIFVKLRFQAHGPNKNGI